MTTLQPIRRNTKACIRKYTTYNRSMIENNKNFPFKLKAEFSLSYAQYMSKNKSFLLDIYSDYHHKPGYSYLLLVYVNNVLIIYLRGFSLILLYCFVFNNIYNKRSVCLGYLY